MTVEKMKTGFVERIGGTIFVVNAMPAEDAKRTQEELVKALIAREAMALQEADVAVGLSNILDSEFFWRKPAKGSHGQVVGAAVVDGKLLCKILK